MNTGSKARGHIDLSKTSGKRGVPPKLAERQKFFKKHKIPLRPLDPLIMENLQKKGISEKTITLLRVNLTWQALPESERRKFYSKK